MGWVDAGEAKSFRTPAPGSGGAMEEEVGGRGGKIDGVDGQLAGVNGLVELEAEGLGQGGVIEGRSALALSGIDADEFAGIAGEMIEIPELLVVIEPVGLDAIAVEARGGVWGRARSFQKGREGSEEGQADEREKEGEGGKVGHGLGVGTERKGRPRGCRLREWFRGWDRRHGPGVVRGPRTRGPRCEWIGE